MATYKVKICDQEVEILKTPMKAIKAQCTDCSVGSRTEVAECPSTMCPLYPFRGFINFDVPRRVLTEEQRKEIGERLNRARIKK